MPAITSMSVIVVILLHLGIGAWLCRKRRERGVWSVGRSSLTFAGIAFISLPVSFVIVRAEFFISEKLWPSADWLLEGLPATLVVFGAAPVIVVLCIAFTLYLQRVRCLSTAS